MWDEQNHVRWFAIRDSRLVVLLTKQAITIQCNWPDRRSFTLLLMQYLPWLIDLHSRVIPRSKLANKAMSQSNVDGEDERNKWVVNHDMLLTNTCAVSSSKSAWWEIHRLARPAWWSNTWTCVGNLTQKNHESDDLGDLWRGLLANTGCELYGEDNFDTQYRNHLFHLGSWWTTRVCQHVATGLQRCCCNSLHVWPLS